LQIVSEARATVPRKLPGRRYDKIFYGFMILLLQVIVFVGFSRRYYLAGVFRAPLKAPILHVHGALNTAWMLLLVVQAFLVSAKKIKWHMTLGIAGFCLAVAMVGVGFVVTANQLHRLADNPDILSFALPFIEQVCFAVLAGAAFAQRKNGAAHKRLILLATIAMMGAAFTRFPVHVADHHKFGANGIYLLLGLMVLYDLWSLHRLHLATVFGTTLVLAYLNSAEPIGNTAVWHQFALWMQSLNL
jgi:hypothetical protein